MKFCNFYQKRKAREFLSFYWSVSRSASSIWSSTLRLRVDKLRGASIFKTSSSSLRPFLLDLYRGFSNLPPEDGSFPSASLSSRFGSLAMLAIWTLLSALFSNRAKPNGLLPCVLSARIPSLIEEKISEKPSRKLQIITRRLIKILDT